MKWMKTFWVEKELERLHDGMKQPQTPFMSVVIKWVDFTTDVGYFCGSW